MLFPSFNPLSEVFRNVGSQVLGQDRFQHRLNLRTRRVTGGDCSGPATSGADAATSTYCWIDPSHSLITLTPAWICL
jgi:hypothetical protein